MVAGTSGNVYIFKHSNRSYTCSITVKTKWSVVSFAVIKQAASVNLKERSEIY